MSLTYGFYNGINHDRTYNAEQVSALFDGLINDGVFDSIGDIFATVPGDGLQVLVKSGKAWFNHTWTINDAPIPLTISTPDVTLARIDAVVLEVNHAQSVRANSIKIKTGMAATNPTKPAMTATEDIHQYPLAYVTVRAAATEIKAADIEINVGKSTCPFVTGIIRSTDIDDLFNQWEGQFDAWFENLKAQLTDDVVANLQKQIDEKLNIADKATDAEALAGTNNTHYMTPALTKKAVEGKIGELVLPIDGIVAPIAYKDSGSLSELTSGLTAVLETYIGGYLVKLYKNSSSVANTAIIFDPKTGPRKITLGKAPNIGSRTMTRVRGVSSSNSAIVYTTDSVFVLTFNSAMTSGSFHSASGIPNNYESLSIYGAAINNFLVTFSSGNVIVVNVTDETQPGIVSGKFRFNRAIRAALVGGIGYVLVGGANNSYSMGTLEYIQLIRIDPKTGAIASYTAVYNMNYFVPAIASTPYGFVLFYNTYADSIYTTKAKFIPYSSTSIPSSEITIGNPGGHCIDVDVTELNESVNGYVSTPNGRLLIYVRVTDGVNGFSWLLIDSNTNGTYKNILNAYSGYTKNRVALPIGNAQILGMDTNTYAVQRVSVYDLNTNQEYPVALPISYNAISSGMISPVSDDFAGLFFDDAKMYIFSLKLGATLAYVSKK